MSLRDTYNTIAEDWNKGHQTDDWWIDGTNTFCSFLPPGGTILDVGCGAGIKSEYLSEKGFKITGIDFSEKFLEIARLKVPEIDFLVLDMKNLDTLDRTFDGVFVQAALLHIPKKEVPGVFDQFVRKLKPGGHLYVAVKELKPGGPEEEEKEKNDYGYSYKRFFSYFLSEELESYFKKSGFTVVYENREQSGKTVWIQAIGRLE